MAIIPLKTVDRGEILTAACNHSADTSRGGPGGRAGQDRGRQCLHLNPRQNEEAAVRLTDVL